MLRFRTRSAAAGTARGPSASKGPTSGAGTEVLSIYPAGAYCRILNWQTGYQHQWRLRFKATGPGRPSTVPNYASDLWIWVLDIWDMDEKKMAKLRAEWKKLHTGFENVQRSQRYDRSRR